MSLLILASHLSLFAQETAFSYHGRLHDNGLPASGMYDFTFVVFDTAEAGAPVGVGVSADAVQVIGGEFRVTLDFGPNVFSGPQRWLEIGVRTNGNLNPHTPLSPRQALLPVPYALHAQSAGSVPASSVAVENLNTGGVLPAAGQILSFDGTRMRWSDPTVAAGGVFSLNGASAYYTAGNVGLGTSTPQVRLDVVADTGDLFHLSGYEPFLTLFDTNHDRQRTAIQSVAGGLNLFTDSYLVGANPFGFMRLDNNGNLGVGSATPQAKLELASGSGDIFRMIGYEPFLTFYDSNHGYARGAIQQVNGGLNFFTDSYLAGANGFAYIRLDNSGNVGLGTAVPQSKLEIIAQDAVRAVGYQPFLTLVDANAGFARSRLQGVNGDLGLMTESYIASAGADPGTGLILLKNGSGNVGIGTVSPQAKLDVNGTTRTKVLAITGGADIAEPFQISNGRIPCGSVVIIDPDRPGQLRQSSEAYDRRVAGIISGANGVRAGIHLHQEGVLEGGQPVALSGRVYAMAEADSSPIEPGDLLTTSEIPGHAMKVADHQRAQGAILGKAMTRLEHGSGMVLVLVTLQ